MSKNQINKTTEQQKNTQDSASDEMQKSEEKQTIPKATEQKPNVANDAVNDKKDNKQIKGKETDKKSVNKNYNKCFKIMTINLIIKIK